MTGLAGLSVSRPWLAMVANLLIVIAGIGALFGVEVRELPDVDRPIVSVRANYPGASPTTVDAEVTSLVESAVARVGGVVAVRSSSEEGNFRMRVEFRPDRDLADASNDVREAVSRVTPRLPAGVEDLFVVKSDQDARAIMNLAVWSDTDSIDVLTRRVEDEVIPVLTAAEGVADISVFGDRQRVLRVEVSPERLAAYGLSIGEVANVLRAAQFDVPVGSFEAGQMEVLVRADATVAKPEKLEQLRLTRDVRLGDLADVYFSLASAQSVARFNGRLVLNLGIIRQAQSNTVQISDDVMAAVDRLKLRFTDLNFVVTNDDAIFIKGSIREVLTSLSLALGIVVLVIWVFFGGIGVTLAPALTIPIALIGSLAAIWLMGFSVNLITLLAMVLATGLVVDDAIVVTENILARRAEGMSPRAAAVVGARQVFFPVIATTLTLIAVFVPISFLPSDAGRLFTEFGFVLAITVTISSFVALTICPMIASRLPSMGLPGGLTGPIGGWLGALYGIILRFALKAPLVTLVVAVGVAGTAGLIYGDLGEELTPPEDRGEVTVWLQGPDGTGLEYTDRQVAQVEEMYRPWLEQGVTNGLYSITGRYDLNRGRIGAQLIPWDQRDATQFEITADINAKMADLAGARGRVWSGNSLNLWSSSGGRISMALTGPTYPEIGAAADAFAERIEEIEGISRPRVQYQATQPQLSVQIDRGRAADLGVEMTDLSSTLRALIDEDEIGELTIGDQAIPIILQSVVGAVRDPSDLLNLSVRRVNGGLAPLSQLISFHEQGVAAELDRHGQRRAVEIDATVAPELTIRDAVDAIRDLSEQALPDKIGLIFLGDAAALEETSSALMATYVIALVVVFLVLIAQFESVISALVVMTTVPFGICAAIYALWLTGTTINAFSQIGVLVLIGIMAKNGILLVEFADQLRDRGLSAWEAAQSAARARLRPISMTLISTVLAGLPLILGSGPGAEARAAIGWVVFGGLGLAVMFTLFLTPAVYALIAGLSAPRAESGRRLAEELQASRESKASTT